MQKFYYFDKKRHGTPDFPVEYYYVDSNHPRYHMAFHWHNEWELIRVIKGELLITLDNKQRLVKEGEIVLIAGETVHGAEAFDCVYECLVFDLFGLFGKIDALKQLLRPFYNGEVIPQRFFTNEDKAVSSVLDVFSNQRESSVFALETLSSVSNLFAWIISENRYYQSQSKSGYSIRIKPVLEYIENHCNEPINLDALADIAGMNSRYFCKIFYAATKTTPINYLNQYRIDHAAFLLETTNLSVTQIGADCGFCDSSYFTKVFKKFKGVTPHAFRNMMREG